MFSKSDSLIFKAVSSISPLISDIIDEVSDLASFDFTEDVSKTSSDSSG